MQRIVAGVPDSVPLVHGIHHEVRALEARKWHRGR